LRGILQLLNHSVWWQVPAAQIGGNIALFVPGGVLLGMRRGRGVGGTVLAGAVVSIVIESAQYVFALGVASVDDVLLACLGTLVGATAVSLARAWARREEPAGQTPAHHSGHAGAAP
jgi:glycopeptide antibiotics resistance protein